MTTATFRAVPKIVTEGQSVKFVLSDLNGWTPPDDISVRISGADITVGSRKKEGEGIFTWNKTLDVGRYKAVCVITPPIPHVDRELGGYIELVAEFDVTDVSRHVNADVSLQQTSSVPTPDQALWSAIRNSTEAITFDRYNKFISLLFSCPVENAGKNATGTFIYGKFSPILKKIFHEQENGHQLNIHGAYAYTVLKVATQAFLTLQTGVAVSQNEHRLLRDKDLNDDPLFDGKEEARRRKLPEGTVLSIKELTDDLKEYLNTNDALPYMDRIVGALLAVHPDDDISEVLPYCKNILRYRATQPSLIELIWSYWHEEGMLAQTMNAIALRFQNQRSGPNDPLAELEIDPLRPLNNMIWGFVQDRYNQLSVSRRAAEYGHQYGLRLLGRAVPELQIADNRSKFIEAFHNLLYRTAVFYREDADTTVVSNAFPLLNALKDVHLLLAEGAHNQYGDLPWTARAEMLTQQWMLARPEMREFLRGRHMVPYQETWMGAVDAMKKLQGWTDTTVSHFHELAVDGERILLSIRFGDWSDDLNLTEDNARNWARYWKPEIQRYLYGYLAVTGVDLMNEVTDTRESEARYLQPSALLQRRLAGQSRQSAALAAPPRRQAIAASAGQGYAALPRPQTRQINRVRAIRYEQGE